MIYFNNSFDIQLKGCALMIIHGSTVHLTSLFSFRIKRIIVLNSTIPFKGMHSPKRI